MVRNAIQSYFWTFKMTTGGHLKKNYKKSCSSDLNNVRTDCWPTTTRYKFTFGQYLYTYRQLCCMGTREYTLCSPFRAANAHNSSCLY